MNKHWLKYRSFILGAAASGLAVSGAWATWSVMRPDGQAAKVLQGNGRLDVQRIEIATKFAGQVLSVPVDEGMTVKPGDVIAQMDPRDYEAQLQGVQAMRQRAAQAMARVSALTDDEASQLAQQIDNAPAGGFIGALLLVFFVLLVTDILGLTKVFPFTRSVR